MYSTIQTKNGGRIKSFSGLSAIRLKNPKDNGSFPDAKEGKKNKNCPVWLGHSSFHLDIRLHMTLPFPSSLCKTDSKAPYISVFFLTRGLDGAYLSGFLRVCFSSSVGT